MRPNPQYYFLSVHSFNERANAFTFLHVIPHSIHVYAPHLFQIIYCYYIQSPSFWFFLTLFLILSYSVVNILYNLILAITICYLWPNSSPFSLHLTTSFIIFHLYINFSIQNILLWYFTNQSEISSTLLHFFNFILQLKQLDFLFYLGNSYSLSTFKKLWNTRLFW